MEMQPYQCQGWVSRDRIHEGSSQSLYDQEENSRWYHDQTPSLCDALPFGGVVYWQQEQPLRAISFGINSAFSSLPWTYQSQLAFSSPVSSTGDGNGFYGIGRKIEQLYETPPPEAGQLYQHFEICSQQSFNFQNPVIFPPTPSRDSVFRNGYAASPLLDHHGINYNRHGDHYQENSGCDFPFTGSNYSSPQLPMQYSGKEKDLSTPTSRCGLKQMTPSSFRIKRCESKRNGRHRFPSLLNKNLAKLKDSNQVEIIPPLTISPQQPPMPDKLYHYTTDNAAKSIIKDQYLRPKGQAYFIKYGAGTSARFGKGIYFTNIPPHRQTQEILTNNYGSEKIRLSQIKRTNYCFEFDTVTLPNVVFCADESCLSPGNELRRFIWMADVQFLHLKNRSGVYYERVVDGFGYPKKVNRKTYDL